MIDEKIGRPNAQVTTTRNSTPAGKPANGSCRRFTAVALTRLRFLAHVSHTLRHQVVAHAGGSACRCCSSASLSRYSRAMSGRRRVWFSSALTSNMRGRSSCVALQRHVEQVIEDRAFLVKERFAAALLARGKPDGQRLLDGGEISRQQFRWRRAERRVRFFASQRQQDGEARNQVVEQREHVAGPRSASVNACSNTTGVASRCAFSMVTLQQPGRHARIHVQDTR